MTLKDIRDYLEEINSLENLGLDNFYIGRFNTSEDNVVKIRSLNYGSPNDKLCIGQSRSYDTIACSLLLHISKDFNKTEEVSNKLYNYFLNNVYLNKELKINDNDIHYIRLLSNNVDIGEDPNSGIFERVIELQFYYNKNN